MLTGRSSRRSSPSSLILVGAIAVCLVQRQPAPAGARRIGRGPARSSCATRCRSERVAHRPRGRPRHAGPDQRRDRRRDGPGSPERARPAPPGARHERPERPVDASTSRSSRPRKASPSPTRTSSVAHRGGSRRRAAPRPRDRSRARGRRRRGRADLGRTAQRAARKAEEALAELDGGARLRRRRPRIQHRPERSQRRRPRTAQRHGHRRLGARPSTVRSRREGGTTEIVRGDDGIYRIGRVTEIVAAGEEPGLREELFETVPEAAVRDLLRYEVGADAARRQDHQRGARRDARAGAHRGHLRRGLPSATIRRATRRARSTTARSSSRPTTTSSRRPICPRATRPGQRLRPRHRTPTTSLHALTDDEIRKTVRADARPSNSDSPSADDGGAVGFVTRSLPPTAVGDALFDAEHAESDLIGPIKGDAG